MPPRTQKRQRGEGPSTPTMQFDRRKFISAIVIDRFDYLVNKALTPECGLRPDEFDGEMGHQINKRSWDTFTDQPELVVVAMVKEFYANVEDKTPFTAFVRGKMVAFSTEAINEYYDLQAPVVRQYTAYKDSGPNYDQILAEICRPETVWLKGKKGVPCL